VNAAVLLFSACLAGADPAAAPAPAAPAVVYVQKDCNGKASCGDCCNKADDCCWEKCCLFQKIKCKLHCMKENCCICDKIKECCEKAKECCHKLKECCTCDKCDKGNKCDKCEKVAPAPAPVVVKQDCNKDTCGKAECNGCKSDCCLKGCFSCNKSCGNKDVCGKAEVSKCDKCDDGCDKCCWHPGYFLHKCKAKLCGLCDKKDDCCNCGGCGTAATPATPVAPVTPVAPKPADPKKIPEKVGSAYPAVRDLAPAGAYRTIDLTPAGN
jgi:hypothetical protein